MDDSDKERIRIMRDGRRRRDVLEMLENLYQTMKMVDGDITRADLAGILRSAVDEFEAND